MKHKTISLIAAIASLMTVTGLNVAYANETFSPALSVVKGKLTDTTTGEPEIGAVIQFFKADNLEKPVAYTLTDSDGSFEHNIDVSGDFVLVFTNVGRKEFRQSFTLKTDETLDLGTIHVEDDIEMLEAGKVVALKDLIKMDVDRITYKVTADADARTSTLLDMLRKVPMVTVDGQDKITVNGSSSFQVLVDGKPNVMMSSNPSQIFKSLPATFASDIQVVTNPGVKYDAEGIGGVLNITTSGSNGSKEALDGYNANISLGGGTTGMTGSGFVTVQKGKLSASANVSAVEAKIPGTTSEMTRDQLDASGNIVSTMKNVSESTLNAPIRIVSSSIGYEINDENLISATLGYNAIASHSKNTNSTDISFANGMPGYGYSSATKSIWDVTSINGGLDYQRSFKSNPDKLFTLSYLFSSSPSDTDSESIFATSFPGMTDRYTDGMTNTLQNTVQADYTTRINPQMTFNAGGKYINRLNKSDQALFFGENGAWNQDMTGSMKYRHNNNIAAGYAEAAYNKDKFGVKAGLRYEHTFQDVSYKLGNGVDFSTDFGNLVPAASVQYNISTTNNIGLTYNMRISRPGITYLNPYVDISDPTVKSYGNSELETERAHNINLVYNYFSQKVILNLSAHYNHTGNAIEGYSFYDKDNILNSTYGNIAKKSTTGLNSMLIYNIGSTRLMANVGVDYNDINSPARNLHSKGWSANALASAQATLPMDIRFSGNLIWSSKSRSLDGWSQGLSMVMLGLNKNILDNRVTIGVTGVAPLSTDGKLVRKSFSEGPDYRIESVSKVPMATVMANVTWSFGSKKNASVKKTRKTITNDDIKDRSNGNEATMYLLQGGNNQ